MLRQLVPEPADDVDPVERYLAARRGRPGGRPWVTLGMVASVDGATALDGTSGGLGGASDRQVFRAVRAVADAVLVAAGTVRAENYGPASFSDEVRAARRRHGRSTEPPRIVVVTASLDLDFGGRLFAEAGDRPPLILTVEDADTSRVAAARQVAEVRTAGRGRVDLTGALAALEDEFDVVVCEGGPSLNGALVGRGLVDELCCTTAAALVGGPSPRLASGGDEHVTDLRLASLLVDEVGTLFSRYVRAAAT